MQRSLFVVLSLMSLIFILFTPVVLAQGQGGAGGGGGASNFFSGFDEVRNFRPEAGIKDVGTAADLILAILQLLTAFLAALAVAAVIYGGFLYIMAGGNETRAETGKKVILYAVIGLIIVGASAILVNIVINFFTTAGGVPPVNNP